MAADMLEILFALNGNIQENTIIKMGIFVMIPAIAIIVFTSPGISITPPSTISTMNEKISAKIIFNNTVIHSSTIVILWFVFLFIIAKLFKN